MINIKKNMIRSKQKGFTLIELMFGVAIALFTIAGALISFVYLAALNNASCNLVIAANDAQYVLEEMKALTYSQLSGYTSTQVHNLNNENIILGKNIGSILATVTVTVNWTENNNAKNFSLSTCFAK
jgi:prepilin-type N-terminal cleavage/methylation domain-containing protein